MYPKEKNKQRRVDNHWTIAGHWIGGGQFIMRGSVNKEPTGHWALERTVKEYWVMRGDGGYLLPGWRLLVKEIDYHFSDKGYKVQ